MSARAWWLFLALGLIWGVPYLLIRIAVADLPPVCVAFARTCTGALLLLPIAIARGAVRPALLGLAIGLGGVAALVGSNIDMSQGWAVSAALATALGYALGPIIINRFLSQVPRSLHCIGLSALLLAHPGGGPHTGDPSSRTSIR